MSTPADTDKVTSPGGPESPTTARPLEMDDDDVQETGVLNTEETTKNTSAAAAPSSGAQTDAPGQEAKAQSEAQDAASTTNPSAGADEAPPAKPPRPMTEAQKNVVILKEAFPSIDEGVIKAVLSASGGRIDPAFNALLEMTDPDAAQNEPEQQAPPPQPPRPSATQMSQLEADELYARQLAEQYDNVGAYEARTSNRSQGGSRTVRHETGLKPNELHDRDHSFFDDDLPVIQEKLRQGFVETQGKVNTWIQTMKKRLDEEFAEEEDPNQNRGQRPQQGQEQFPGPRPGQSSRRSGDYERYDADPQVLSDDFAGMKFTSDGTPVREHSGSDAFRPPPPSKSPRSADGRKVAFREDAEEIDVYGSSPGGGSAKPKSSKWQPLSTVDPSPINDNDPFSLGDSEDERDTKDKSSGSKGEIKMDDNERLKQAAAEAMAEDLVDKPTGADAKKD